MVRSLSVVGGESGRQRLCEARRGQLACALVGGSALARAVVGGGAELPSRRTLQRVLLGAGRGCDVLRCEVLRRRIA